MTVPFMRAYTELLVKTCHRRGAHAMGGMAAFIPSRKDAKVNEIALQKVREDKQREVRDGFDGTWVAHPDLVPVAQAVFDSEFKNKPNQKNKMREDVNVRAEQLTDFKIPGGAVTENGVRNNISVALQYLESWLRGQGAVGIFNLMEDAATAEISRAELWQWVHGAVNVKEGRSINSAMYEELKNSELKKLGDEKKYAKAVELLDGLVLNPDFPDFLTIPAYRQLVKL
jgi:malate synthase